MANSVGYHGDDAGNTAQSNGLSSGEADGESAQGLVVSVEDLGRAVVRRERSDDAGVPVVVGGEGERLVRFGNVNDEGLLAIGGESRREEREG